MNIIVYQIEKDVVTFGYKKSITSAIKVASCLNYGGMFDFVKLSGAEQLNNNVNLYDYIAELEKAI
jgi:hypothetical protein